MTFGAVLLVNSQTVTYNCPQGWVTDVSNNRCYKFVYYPKQPYVLAAKDCAESSASLLSVTTSTEHSFVNSYLMTYDPNRSEWYTSGRQDANNVYIWEGEGLVIRDIVPEINYWMQGYQYVPEDRLIYKFDYTANEYRWYVGANTIKRSYICEIRQEDAYRVLIQRRDFTFGTPYLNEEDVPIGPTFDPDGVPENIWYLSSTTSLYLECLAIGNPQPVYRWLRGTTDSTITEEVKSSSDNRFTLTNGKLTITDPDQRDSQYYRCEASNSEGTIISNFASLSLGKLGEFSNVADAPVTSYEFEGAVIECSQITYEPSIVYNWERDIGRIEDIFVENNEYIFISSNGRLYFSEVNQNDAGKYYCRVSLSGISRSITGSAQPPSAVSRPIVLDVRRQAAKADWGPIFQDDFINVFPKSPGRGSDVRLECFAYGTATGYKTSWTFRWSREGGLPKSVRFENLNRVLIIKNAQAEDEGKYRCEVTRGSNTVSREYTLVLQTKPYFLNPLRAQHIDIGSQLSWQCLADGNPSPVYSWYYNGALISPSDTRFTVSRNILRIATADPQLHNGMYQCGATNIRGQILSSAQLRVLSFKPTFSKHPLPPALSGAERGNITIPCQPEGSPRPTIKWSRRSINGGLSDIGVSMNTGQPVDTTAKFQMTLNGDLIIRDITMGDAGDYICTATNNLGEDYSACRLDVQTGTTLSVKPSTLKDAYKRTQNETVFIHCEASYDKDLDLIYVWSFNGKRLDLDKDPYYIQSYNPTGLYIRPLQYFHAGVYECTALTPLNSESAPGTVTVEGFPEAPSGIYADSGRITTNSLVLFWTDGDVRSPGGILEYEIMANVAEEPGEWYPATRGNERVFHVDTTIPSADNKVNSKQTYRLTSLLPGNNYAFKIRAKNIKGWSEYSLPSAFYQTRSAAPDLDYNQISLNLTGGGGSVGDLTVKWNPLPKKYHGGSGLYYTIFWKRITTDVWSSNNYTAKENDNIKGQLSFVTLVGAENFYLPYHVMIMPANNYGRGQNSSIKVIYSAMEMPTLSPILSHCNAINATAMDVFWTPIENTREKVGGEIAGFQVNYWTTGQQEPVYKNFIRFNLQDGVVPTHGVVIGLKINHYSTFDVQVFNTAGLGPRSDPYNCETANDPTHHYPIEVRVYPRSATSVDVTWRGVLITTDEATVIGYKIFLWPSNENFRTAFEYETDFSPTRHTLTNLEQGVVYALRISAVSSAGDGQKSPTIYFAIAGGPATLIDQTVTEFTFLSGSSITSSIVLIAIATAFVYFMS